MYFMSGGSRPGKRTTLYYSVWLTSFWLQPSKGVCKHRLFMPSAKMKGSRLFEKYPRVAGNLTKWGVLFLGVNTYHTLCKVEVLTMKIQEDGYNFTTILYLLINWLFDTV